MYFALIVVALWTTVAAQWSCKEGKDLPEKQLNLSRYQDAWKSVQNPAKRYQLYRSYDADKVYGGSSKCMYIKQTKQDPACKTALTEMGYYNATAKKIMNHTACTRVEIPDVIRAASCANSPLIFSDYLTCDVVRAPHTGNSAHCELWVAESHIDKVNPICEFAYDVFCDSSKKYFIFDATCYNQANVELC